MTDIDATHRALNNSGRVWLRQAISKKTIAALISALDLGTRPGARVAESNPLFRQIRNSDWIKDIQILWPDVTPVRVVSFSKSPDTNWSVPWHQDRVIPVKAKAPVPGYDNWSQKAGIWHCEPPLPFLERMLFVRVHLDRNNAANGAMQIAKGSHMAGLVAAGDAAKTAQEYETETCEANPGDILIMKMLTLHRSLPSNSNTPRRTLRVDFSADALPDPLQWA